LSFLSHFILILILLTLEVIHVRFLNLLFSFVRNKFSVSDSSTTLQSLSTEWSSLGDSPSSSPISSPSSSSSSSSSSPSSSQTFPSYTLCISDEDMRNRYNSLVNTISSLQAGITTLQNLRGSIQATRNNLQQVTNNYNNAVTNGFSATNIQYFKSQMEYQQTVLNGQIEFFKSFRTDLLSRLSTWKSDLDSLKNDDACQRFSYSDLENKYNTAKTTVEAMTP
jgi:chromosome segregation ATPase